MAKKVMVTITTEESVMLDRFSVEIIQTEEAASEAIRECLEREFEITDEL